MRIRMIKSLIEEEIPSRKFPDGLGGAHLPDPLKPLTTSWENTERIASLYSYSQVLAEPFIFSGLKCRFNKTAVNWPSWWFQWTHHTLQSFRLQLTQTDLPLQGQRIYGPCAPQRSLQLCQLPLLTYSGVPQQKPQINGKTVIQSGRDPSPLFNSGCSRTDGRLAL